MPVDGDRDDAPDEDWLVEEAREWGVDTPTVEASPGLGASATPGSHDRDSVIAKVALVAMRDRRHSSIRPEREVRQRLGSGDSTLYVMDDGLEHCMIARLVGEDADGAVYCLVARIGLGRFRELETGGVSLDDAFRGARDIELTSVFEAGSASNTVNVEHYGRVEDVPPEYLPPSPYQQFT